MNVKEVAAVKMARI